jgi:hypothetical protein
LFILLIFSAFSFANISGVMGPNIDPTDRSIQFRNALSLAEHDIEQDQWAYRLHYQHAFNDTFRARLVMQYRDEGNFEYDFFRTELLYNFKKRGPGEIWSSAFRFDFRTRRGSRSEEFAVHSGNQWDLKNGYRLRATVILSHQIDRGEGVDDLGLQTRGSFSKKLESGIRIGLQMLNQHGAVGDLDPFEKKGIYLGPALSGDFGRFTYEMRYLRGMTNEVPEDNFFFRVTTSL